MLYLASMANSFWGPFDFFKPQKVLIYNGLSHVNPRRQSNYQDLANMGIRVEDNNVTSLTKIHFHLDLRESPEN